MQKLKIPIFIMKAIVAIAFFIYSPLTRADENIFMLFLQPGGEGSAEEAQPLLNDFFSKVKESGGPSITGFYSNNLEEGLTLIKQKKTGIVILGPDILEHSLTSIDYSKILSTLPLGTGDAYEKYYLLTKSGLKTNDLECIWTSREFQGDFVAKTIFKGMNPALNSKIKIDATSAPLGTLKKIATSGLSQAVLLDSYEYQSFKRLKMDNLKEMTPVFQSPEVPSSSVILFGTTAPNIQKSIEDAFLKISADSKGKEILSNLRLKGFRLVNSN